MQVVGKTNEREIWVASSERAFRLNELLIVEGSRGEECAGEVVETYSLNPMVPLVDENSPFLMDSGVLDAMGAFAYDLEQDTIYLAKVRLITELFYPVRTGSPVKEPLFPDVADLLVKAGPESALCIGVIQGTENLHDSLPLELKNLAPLLEEGQVIPQCGVPFLLDYRRMQDYPHIGVFGGSGSGKSFALRVLIEEFIRKRIPLLIFDPHFEMSFADAMLDGEFDVKSFAQATKVLTVGQDIGVNFAEITENDFCNLLGSVSGLSEAMDAAARTCFVPRETSRVFERRLNLLIDYIEDLANDDVIIEMWPGSDEQKRAELQRIREMARKIGHSASLKAIRWRFASLIREGIFHSAGVQPVEEAIRAQKAVVVRGSIRVLRIYSSFVLRNLYQQRRDYRDAVQKGEVSKKFPPFVVITDEAHNFAPKGDIPAPARSEFREIAQEGRKYGVFLVLATQRPALLDETINAQLNTKFIFRTVRSLDLSVISEETDLGKEGIRRLPYLPSGYGFISSPLIGRSIAVRIRASFTRSPHQENPFDELEEMADEQSKAVMEVLEPLLPINETDFNHVVMNLEKRGIKLTIQQFQAVLDRLVEEGILLKENKIFVTQYRKV